MIKYTKEDKEDIVCTMLEMIGENPNRSGLKGTPERVVRMWGELFKGYDKEQKPKITTFDNGDDGIVYDEMISDEGTFYSHCEHHVVPFFGKYYFAYIPHPKGKILGLSKVARIVDYYSSKLQIQERLANDIVMELWNMLSKGKHKPVGIGLVLEGEHLCKTMRGVKKKGKMRTTKLLGVMKSDPATRAEFFGWVNRK